MNVARVSVEQAKALLQQPDTNIIDIRDPDSFAAAHIKGAIPFSGSAVDELMQAEAETNPTVVVCYHGISSLMAAEHLHGLGFNQVMSMDGGMEAWIAAFPELCEPS